MQKNKIQTKINWLLEKTQKIQKTFLMTRSLSDQILNRVVRSPSTDDSYSPSPEGIHQVDKD